MNEVKSVHGILWDDGVICNARWAGIRLRDLLQSFGVTSDAGRHVCFASHVTLCQDDKDYGGSVPLAAALDPDADMLLAYEVSSRHSFHACPCPHSYAQMNGQPLSPDHGWPLRVVAPGYLGARWVKWVDTIAISQEESPNFYQQRDYKVLPEEVCGVTDAAPRRTIAYDCPQIDTKDKAAPVWCKYPSLTSTLR